MKLIKTIFVDILLVLLLSSINVLSQENCNKILFLNFYFINGTPELDGMTVVRGKMKTRKDETPQKPGYSFEIVSNEKQILYKDNFEDPFENISEYPGDNGEIKRVTVKKDTASYTIRVPYSKYIDKIVLYKIAAKTSLVKSSGNPFEAKYEFIINHSLIKQKN